MDTAAVVTSNFPVLRREQMWNAMQRLVLNGLSSPHTRRAYFGSCLDHWREGQAGSQVDGKPLSYLSAEAILEHSVAAATR
jgi:hypothetical protein